MVNIKLQENAINIKEDTQELSQNYNKILYNLKTFKIKEKTLTHILTHTDVTNGIVPSIRIQ